MFELLCTSGFDAKLASLPGMFPANCSQQAAKGHPWKELRRDRSLARPANAIACDVQDQQPGKLPMHTCDDSAGLEIRPGQEQDVGPLVPKDADEFPWIVDFTHDP